MQSSFLLAIAKATSAAVYKEPEKTFQKLDDHWKTYVNSTFGIEGQISNQELEMRDEYEMWRRTLVTISRDRDGKLIAKVKPNALKPT